VGTSRRELARILQRRSIDLVEWDSEPDEKEIERSSRIAWADAERCLAATDLAAPVLTETLRPRVLDVGAGYLYMSSAFRLVYGEKLSLSTLEHPARRRTLMNERFVRALDELGADLRTADLALDELPWEEGTFDVVLFCDVIEHLEPTVVPKVMSRLASLLRPGGRLIISSPNLPAFSRLAILAFGRGAIFEPPTPLEYAGGTYGHIRLYGRSDVEHLASAAGLGVTDWRFLNWERVFIPHRSLRERLLYSGQAIAPRLAKHLSTSWIVACEKPSGRRPTQHLQTPDRSTEAVGAHGPGKHL
jgi:SAM-dependent methyltransferase